MAEVQLTVAHNILANEQQHYEQSESIYDTYLLEKVDRNTTPDSTDMSHRGGEIDQNVVKSTPHYLPKVKESVLAKSHHVIAPGSSRNSSKESYGSNDMPHNYYLEEAKKKTQDKNRNLKPREMPSARTHHSPNTCTPKPRSNNKTFRSWPVQSLKTRNSNKPVEPKIHIQKPGKQIVTGNRFSPNKSSAVHEKTNTPRSCLRWIPTGRIFNPIGLRWVPTGKIFTSSTTKVNSEPLNGSNEDITNPYKCD
ncbi:hypothetical protein Tco_0604480 [Tanacetum coccineum]